MPDLKDLGFPKPLPLFILGAYNPGHDILEDFSRDPVNHRLKET